MGREKGVWISWYSKKSETSFFLAALPTHSNAPCVVVCVVGCVCVGGTKREEHTQTYAHTHIRSHARAPLANTQKKHNTKHKLMMYCTIPCWRGVANTTNE